MRSTVGVNSGASLEIKVGAHGHRGVFAGRTFRPGEVIRALTGPVSPVRTRTSIQVAETAHVEDEYGRFVNHNCRPNARVEHGVLYAAEAIQVGDEVSFDYLANESEISVPFFCYCCGQDIGGPSRMPVADYEDGRNDAPSLLSRQLEAQGFIYLPGFLSEDLHEVLLREHRRLDTNAKDKDFVMESSNTKRRFRAIGGRAISDGSPLIVELYAKVKKFIEKLLSIELFCSAHAQEFAVINHMTPGDEHGWHMDDPSHVLVFSLRASASPDDGGVCEMISNCVALGGPAIERAVADAVAEDRVSKLFLRPRDAYLIRGDRTLHRVGPLSGGLRTILAFSFDDAPAKAYGDSADHLYG